MADLTQDLWYKQLTEDRNAVIIDVRTQAEVVRGVIPNALHIDIYRADEFLDTVDKMDRSKSYYVYCRVGARSGKACNIMNQMGFKYTYNLLGGIEKWNGPLGEL